MDTSDMSIGQAKKVYDHIYYVSIPSNKDLVTMSRRQVMIMGTLQSETAEVSVKELADPENLSGRDLEVRKGEGYKLDASGNNAPMDSEDHSFTTRTQYDGSEEENKIFGGVIGTAAYEIAVTDGGKTETYYLLLNHSVPATFVIDSETELANGTEGWENSLQDITLTDKDGKPLADGLQYAKGIPVASENKGVCGIAEKAVIPDDIQSIRLKLTRGVFDHRNFPTNPYEDYREEIGYDGEEVKTIKDRELFYREND